ncbi:MAG TPA: tetratricopeptide repeat protein [Acidobacteriota bacterium]|nr:tetratricopeptide repeat protein [Acidobacteriota bacterium]
MESYRLSSKLRQKDREYLIQTSNDANLGSVLTTVYVDGVPAETISCPHPSEINAEEVLSFVKATHGEKKKEIETLLQSYRRVSESADVERMYHLATAFFYKGFHNEARDLFMAVTDLSPGNHQAYNFLGMTELALRRLKEALGAAAQAVSERPGYADYHNNYAEIFLANNDHRQAIAELQKAIDINMYYSDAYFNLGLAHLLAAVNSPDSGRLAEVVRQAGDCFHRASLIYANFKGEAFQEGMKALRDHDFIRALGIFKRIREEKKATHRREFAAFYMKFVLYPEWVSEKAVVERIRFLKSELSKNPTYVDLHAELAECYFEQAKLAWKEGMEELRRTAEINPSIPKIPPSLDRADAVYSYMNDALMQLVEKG